MSHTISVRLDDALHDNLTTIASVTGVRFSHLIRDMLRDQAESSLASLDFHTKLADRQAALARLTAYAPSAVAEEPAVPSPTPSHENGTISDLSALIE